MGPRSIAGNRLGLVVRAALLLAGLSTYLISPDDVVWRFIRTAPHARALEHALFGIAAAILGFALLLKVKASAHPENRDSHGPSRITAPIVSILQAIGIGSLLPLPASYCLYLAMWSPVCSGMADIRPRKIPDLKGRTPAEPAGRCRHFDGETLWPHT
jgi:hypothetical protein